MKLMIAQRAMAKAYGRFLVSNVGYDLTILIRIRNRIVDIDRASQLMDSAFIAKNNSFAISRAMQ